MRVSFKALRNLRTLLDWIGPTTAETPSTDDSCSSPHFPAGCFLVAVETTGETMPERTGPATPEKLRELCDLFINRMLSELDEPNPPPAILRVVSDFLKSTKIDFRRGQESEALRKLLEPASEDFVPFVDPITRKRY